MRRTNASGATGDGRFKETPAPATKVTAADLNMLWDELCNIVTNPLGGNTALNAGDNGQLLTAILAMINRTLTPDAETLVLGTWIFKTGKWRGGAISEIAVPIQFLHPFPAGYQVTFEFTGAIPSYSNQRDLWPQISDDGTSVAGFTCQFQSDDGQAMGIGGFDWLAIGRPA